MRGWVSLALLVVLVLAAAFGPFIAPHSPTETVGVPGTGPTSEFIFGTDFLGRDVLSRLLSGGASVLLLSAGSIFATYLIGVTVGMTAASVRPHTGGLIMRGVDLFIVFPPMLLLLVLIAGVGTGWVGVFVGIVLVLFPGVARLVRTLTMEVRTASYVEVAVARGESVGAVMTREVWPNIRPNVLADLGVRFSAAIILTASVSFLGLGAQPPDSNWGLMVAENRPVMATNLAAVVVPACVLAVLAVSINLLSDALSQRRSSAGDDE